MEDRPDTRLDAPAARRNQDALWQVLAPRLPATQSGEISECRVVLEVASGTGQHAAAFAARAPALVWQPSDPDPAMRRSIDAHAEATGLSNLRPALALDARAPEWPVDRAAAMLCVNMLHIAPWAAAEGLFAGAGRILHWGGPLFIYGPFKRDGRHTAESNARFDLQLRQRDPAWGVRDLNDIEALGATCGLDLVERIEMPANNLTLVFRRR
jgi:SAM-dependent methyltransferase